MRYKKCTWVATTLSWAPVLAFASNDSSSDTGVQVLVTFLVVAWIAIVATGGVAGWRQSIVVFRNFDDLAMVFFLGLDAIAAFYLVAGLGSDYKWLVGALLILALGAFLWLFMTLVRRTWTDNPSAGWFLIALVTKLSLAILFLLNLVELVTPSGKTQVQRSRNRAAAIGVLMIITPIVYRLVRDKQGIWAPRDLLNRYQRSRLGL